jgi:cobalt-zinc-cadmium efflux system protein
VSHAHAHGHHGHAHLDRTASRRALSISLAFTVGYGLVQIVTGVLFDSLSLIADAVHNVSDGAAIALALGAAWAAGLPARGSRTYGWRRAEILAALVNGLALVVISLGILLAAFSRFRDPPTVDGLGVLIVGLVGVVANGIPVVIMWRAGPGHDLNLRAAMVHAGTDVLGSAGAALAGLLVWTMGWQKADPFIASLIGILVLLSAWSLVRDSLRILLEAAPGHLDPDEIGQALAGAPGVREVHDLHVWTITSGFPALSAHVVARAETDSDRLLHELEALLQERFGLVHTTIQIDREHDKLLQIDRPGEQVRRTRPVGLDPPHDH